MNSSFKPTLLKSQFVVYADIFKKLLIDSLYRFKYITLLILFTGIAGSIILAAAIGQTFYYAKAFDLNKQINILQWSFEARSLDLFLCFCAILLTMLASASVLSYYSYSKIIELMGEYEAYCSKRIIGLLARVSGINVSGGVSLYSEKDIFALLNQAPQFNGRILKMMMQLIQPTFTFMFSVGILIYTNWWLTLVVVAVISLSLILHYFNNLAGAIGFREFFKLNPDAIQVKRNLLNISRRKGGFEGDLYDEIESAYSQGPIRSTLEMYKSRYQVIEKAKFINNLTITLLFITVTGILGGSAFALSEGWGELIVFLLAMRYSMNQLQQVFVNLTGINRFYFIFANYFDFLDQFSNRTAIRQDNLKKYHIIADGNHSQMIRLYPDNGHILALITPVEFNQQSLPAVFECLLKNKENLIKNAVMYSRVINYHLKPIKGLSVREIFNIPEGIDTEMVRRSILSAGNPKEAIDFIQDLDQPCKENIWHKIPRDMIYTLAFFSAFNSDCNWIVVESKVLNNISESVRKNILEQIKTKYVIVIYSDIDDFSGGHGEDSVVLSGGDLLIGSGSTEWFTKNKPLLAKQFLDAKTSVALDKIQREKDVEDDDMFNDEFE